MYAKNKKDRILGAIIGAFIGDAMGVGCHWYYDLDKMKKQYGDWIDDYVTPKEGHYHDGLRKGELSESGYLHKLMIQSVIENNGYNQQEFCKLLDDGILSILDNNITKVPGHYTNQSIRELFQKRVIEKKSWGNVAGSADTTEALERIIPLAIFYSNDLKNLAQFCVANTQLTQIDATVGAMSLAYAAVLSELINGKSYDEGINSKLLEYSKLGKFPFYSVNEHTGYYSSPEALLTPAYIATAAEDLAIKIQPSSKVAQLYGLSCSIYHVLPAAYYLSAKYKNNFESGMLHAINGGGQNLSRALLTATLIGAQVGLSNIPEKYINGLEEKDTLLKQAHTFTKKCIGE